jgi:hypothetical protein
MNFSLLNLLPDWVPVNAEVDRSYALHLKTEIDEQQHVSAGEHENLPGPILPA